MNKLKIIQKKDNVVFQTIDFSKVDIPIGNVMTIIFDNVIVSKEKEILLEVSNAGGQILGYRVIYFNAKTQKFILKPD